MKYVQVGILVALVLVATLLGLNLLRDTRGVDPQPIPAAAATPVPDPDAQPEAEAPTAEATPAATPAPAAEPLAANTVATRLPARDPEPVVREAAKAPVKPAPKPSPTPSAKPAAQAAAPPTPKPQPQPEPITVDPPSSGSARDLPPPPVETAEARPSTPRYDIMKPEAAPESNPAVTTPPRTVTIPAGTILTIRTVQSLSTRSNASGDTFTGTLDQPLVHEDLIIAERGARVEGKVLEVTESGRVKGLASMSIQLTRINTSDGQAVEVQTQPFTMEAEKNTRGDVTKVGIAAGIGAALGAIFGGGKGAAIGAAAGGAAGTGGVLASKGKAAEIPSETRINFRLDQPLTLTEKINQ